MLVTRFEETVPRWEASEAFRGRYNPAEDNNPLYLDHPQFEGFEIRQMGHRETAEWHGATRHARLEQKFEFLVRVEEIGRVPWIKQCRAPWIKQRAARNAENEWSR
jgi:hypothetical protein